MSETAIKVEGLTFAYGRKEVLNGVDLEVPKGSIFGFLGRNGAGKTTTIKTLLGLLKASGGRCEVLGMDVRKGVMDIRRRVGYMAEDQRMYGWMTIKQIIKWVSSFYPGWDNKFTAHLAEVLELPKKAKVKNLSKGQNSKLALLLALGHRPEVVILDDPTLGLDPIARKEFLRYVISLLQSNGVTVFFSSHLLYEIEPVADRVAILEGGKIIRTAKTFKLRESVKKLVMQKTEGFDFRRLGKVLDVSAHGDKLGVTVEDFDKGKVKELKGEGNFLRQIDLNLDEIFEAYVIGNRGEEARV
jgi:ABC-2 type transport system ATP-binding protein